MLFDRHYQYNCYNDIMDGFNINHIILGLQNSNFLLRRLKNAEELLADFNTEFNQSSANKTDTKTRLPLNNFVNTNTNTDSGKTQNTVSQNLQELITATEQMKVNKFPNTDRSEYIRNVLGLPKTLGDALLGLQNQQKALPLQQFNIPPQNVNPLNNPANSLNIIFDEKIAQTEKLIKNALPTEEIVQIQNQPAQKDTMSLIFAGMINMSDVSKLITTQGKHAVANLIIAMASSSKQGIDNEQLKKTLSIINSCISMANSDNPAQTLKSLMMLYLPWLPLNDGVGFDLEISSQEGENDSNNSKLTVLIQTKNYGNVKGDFVLTTSNSVEVLITCAEGFPKKTLLENLKNEGDTHAMNTNIDIEEV